jgi:hypothetical protein
MVVSAEAVGDFSTTLWTGLPPHWQNAAELVVLVAR